jgi:hypothetical protein
LNYLPNQGFWQARFEKMKMSCLFRILKDSLIL